MISITLLSLGASMNVHSIVGHRATSYFAGVANRTAGIPPEHAAAYDAAIKEYATAVLAGADFPDFLYACGSYKDHHDAGEAAQLYGCLWAPRGACGMSSPMLITASDDLVHFWDAARMQRVGAWRSERARARCGVGSRVTSRVRARARSLPPRASVRARVRVPQL